MAASLMMTMFFLTSARASLVQRASLGLEHRARISGAPLAPRLAAGGRIAPRRAHVACRDNLSDEDIASLRDEYAEWIERDPVVREPLFWTQVERARERAAQLRERKKLLATQLGPLREVLRVWSAWSGVAFVREEVITAAGWVLTVLAAVAPVAALRAISSGGERAVSTVLRGSERASSSWDF